MNRAERIRRTRNIISSRKSKIKQRRGSNPYFLNYFEPIEDGYFENNSIMNYFGCAGCALKTKTRKGHASYRHKGAYGPAKRYSRHDKRQIERYLDLAE